MGLTIKLTEGAKRSASEAPVGGMANCEEALRKKRLLKDAKLVSATHRIWSMSFGKFTFS
jgi:hypothetical protein